MWYMIAEMVPWEDVVDHPSQEFSPGMGFESPNCEVLVYGPVEDYKDLETDYERLDNEGYHLQMIIDYTRETDSGAF
jgi:hypothetical protein